MTTNDRYQSHRRLDVPSLLLLLIGIASGVFAVWLISDAGVTPLVLVPSVVAGTVGTLHLTKRQAPRP